MVWTNLHSTPDPHLGVVPAPHPHPEVTHTPHLTLISASEPSWEGQPPTFPSRQGALGGPLHPRRLSFPQGPGPATGTAWESSGSQSPPSELGLPPPPRNEGLGVACFRNPSSSPRRMHSSLR